MQHRYILDRKYYSKYAGVMAPAPTFLVHPWEVEEVGESRGFAQGGDGFAASNALGGRKKKMRKLARASVSNPTCHANLNFLQHSAVAQCNLRPDESGVVHFYLDSFYDSTFFDVIAVDGDQVVSRTGLLPGKDTPLAVRELALKPSAALNPTLHYSEELNVTLLRAGEKFQSPCTEKLEVFSTLDEVCTCKDYRCLEQVYHAIVFLFLSPSHKLLCDCRSISYMLKSVRWTRNLNLS
tara:strand:+ start:1172 stop:1885 length:714 start_codon:yes stop_codon:yes gene_type:complete